MSENEPENPVHMAKPAEFRDLPCKLNEIELSNRSYGLALDQGVIEQIELEKKEDSAHHNSKLKSVRARMNLCAKEIRDGQMIRSVEVRWLLDAEGQMVRLHRQDTGEMISERPMTDAERQGNLFVVPDEGLTDSSS